jgi:transcriptional regulator with XRE-family HTH domain
MLHIIFCRTVNERSNDMSDITGAQIRAARALIRWRAEDLAQASGVGIATIRRAELIDGVVTLTGPNVAAVRRALEAAGVEFTNGGQPGVRMRSPYAISLEVREGVEFVVLRPHAGGEVRWLTPREAQEEALREERRGNKVPAGDLRRISQAPPVTSLPEDDDASRARG